MKYFLAISLTLFVFSLKSQTIPDTLWSYSLSRYMMGTPAIEDNRYYVGNEKGTLLALDIESGKEIWKTQLFGGIYHNILIVGENLFVDFSEGIACIDKKSGKQKWITSEGYKFDDDVPCELVQNDDDLVFNTVKSTIVCIAQSNGKERWRFKANGDVSPVSAYKNSYFFTCSDGYLYAISKKTGIQEVKIKIEGQHDKFPFFGLKPIIHDDVCVFHLFGEVTAISLKTNQIIWKNEEESPFLFQFGKNVVSMTDQGIVAFDINNGKFNWVVSGKHAWYMRPVFFDGKMYYLSRKDGTLIVVSPDGQVKSMQSIKGKTYTSPQVTSDKIIFAIGDKIFAIAKK